MLPIPHFRGPAKYRLRCLRVVSRALAHTTARRLLRGPRVKGWNLAVELGTAIVREQLIQTFNIPEVAEQRRYLDCLVFDSPAVRRTNRRDVVGQEVRGTWHIPASPGAATMLYLHGGGFAFYPRESYANLVALLTLATNTSTFAVDYRLAPEHPFPAGLEDARAAYLWLIRNHAPAHQVIVAGDSAGGNLTLALLCDLRDRGLPLPALGVALSPATEFDAVRPSMKANEDCDWITGHMALQWRDWYCKPEERGLPLVSPIHANLRGLPPIYIQAGASEILYDSIAAFAAEAQNQSADVTLESWPGMNHVFQFFGEDAPQSADALSRIGMYVTRTVPVPA